MNKYILLTVCTCILYNGAYAQESVQKRLSIDEMFALAEENSKSLRADKTGVEESLRAIKEAKNARLPEISAEVSVNYIGDGRMWERDFSDKMNIDMPHFGNNLTVKASQVIYSGGAIRSSIDLARLQSESARWTLEDTRDKTRLRLVGYYLDLFKQQNLSGVYDANIAQTRQVLDELRAKEREGVVLHNDITRYELQLSNLELQRTRIENNRTILNNHLVVLLGLPAGTAIVPDTALLTQEIPVGDESYWTKSGIEQSPALKQCDIAIKMEQQQNKIIRSTRIPKIALFAGNNLNGPILIEVPAIDKNFNYWYVGVGIKYNFDALFKSPRELSRSRLSIRRAQQTREHAAEETVLSVQAEYVKYLESYLTVQTQEKSAELANRNYAVVHNRYQNDMALITDMLDASNAKLAAEAELVNARIDVIFSYYKLLYISGTL